MLFSQIKKQVTDLGLNSDFIVHELCYVFFYFILLELIYSIVLVSDIQQSESVIHIHISTFLKDYFPI